MKVSKKQKPDNRVKSILFPDRFERKGSDYFRLAKNKDSAVYSVFDRKTDKILGFIKKLKSGKEIKVSAEILKDYI